MLLYCCAFDDISEISLRYASFFNLEGLDIIGTGHVMCQMPFLAKRRRMVIMISSNE